MPTNKSDKLTVYEADIEDFTEDEHNANQGSIRGGAMVETSIREYGAGRSVLADADNEMIAGNQTLKQAKNAGVKKVIVVESEGDALIVHKRRDLNLDDDGDKRARELAYMDNRTGEVGLTWDPDQIAADLAAGVDLGLAFYDDELAKIAGDPLDDDPQDDKAQDAVPEMELHPFEHYDYLVVLFKDTFDFTRALDLFGVEREGFTVTKGVRKIGLGRCIDGAQVIAMFDKIRRGET